MKYIKILLIFCLVNGVFLSAAPDVPAAEGGTAIDSGSIETGIRELTGLGIDQEKARELTLAMLENRFSPEQVREVHRVFFEARQHNLPLNPLINKADEGMVKRVSPDLIIRAMKMVQSRYAFANRQSRALFPGRSTVSPLNRNIVAGLTAGIKEKEMVRISAALRQRSSRAEEIGRLSSSTFGLVKDIARLGVSSDKAAGLAVQALARDYSAAQIDDIRASFISLSNTNDADELAGSFIKAVQSGKGSGAFSDHGFSSGQGSFHSGGPAGGPAGSGGGGGPGGAGGGGGGGGGR